MILPAFYVILFLWAGTPSYARAASPGDTPPPLIPAAEGSTRPMLGAGQELQVMAVRCPFDTLMASASGVPVAVELLNSSDTDIEIQYISIYFTFISQGDRNSDYSVAALPPTGGLIPSGGSRSFDFLVDVLDGALTNEMITVEAFAFGIREDNLGQVTAGSYDTRIVLDEFEVVSYDNNDGDTDWKGPWVEIGESDGPGGGLVFITDESVTKDSVLAIGAKAAFEPVGIQRDVDLSGAFSAFLELTWIRAPSPAFTGKLLIQVSADGGFTWNDLQTVEGGTGFKTGDESLNITPYISSGTTVRLITDGACSGFLYFSRISVVFRESDTVDRWVVQERGLIASLAVFDTRNTADRADDSLIVTSKNEMILFNTVAAASAGGIFCEIPYEPQNIYRLVIQYHSIDLWDWSPDDPGKGYFAFNDPAHGFGRAGSELPGTKEFLLTEGMLGDDEEDPVDCLIGATVDRLPPYEWDPMTDPFTEDPNVDTAALGEYGSLVEGLDPPRSMLGCVDGGKNWAITTKCEPGKSYFHELWFVPDNEWEHGDTADILLHIDGSDPAPDLTEYHILFRMIDDDVEGPSFADFSPEIVESGTEVFVSCLITDTRGVFDDDTGSDGQGVYLLWDTDGEITGDSYEIQMDSIGEGYFRTQATLGTFAEGTRIVYSVHACDDDIDTGIGDRSCSWSPVQGIKVVGSIAVFDIPGSFFPSSVYPAEDNVVFRLDLSNPNTEDLNLDRSLSYMVIDDGTTSATAMLANNTVLLAGVVDYTVVFEETGIPADINAPDTIDVLLHLEGLYDGTEPWAQEWNLSSSNDLVIVEPAVTVKAHSLPSPPVLPGAKKIELLRLEFVNESMENAYLDEMVVLNASLGYLGSPVIDGMFDRLYLYRQGESDEIKIPDPIPGEEEAPLTRPFTNGDSLAASGVMEMGKVEFALSSAKTLPPWEPVFYYVLADVDSFIASDGDRLDLAVSSPASISMQGGMIVKPSAVPLNSEGTAQVDGCVSFQIDLVETAPDTLWSGMKRQVVMGVLLPSNGRSSDVLSSMAVMNFGDQGADAAFEKMELWRDDGDGVFSPDDDALIGSPVYTGNWFEVSGLNLPVLGSVLVFATADAGQDFTEDMPVRFGIPRNGLQYVSGNDGPIDMDVIPARTQLLARREYVDVSIPPFVQFPAVVAPGERDALIMAVLMENFTLSNLRLDTLVVRYEGSSSGCVTSEILDMYLDDGDLLFNPYDDAHIASASGRPGGYEFETASLTVEPGESAILFISTDIDSFLVPDGETFDLSIESASDVVFGFTGGVSFDIDGDFPLSLDAPPVVDGMMAHQVILAASQDTTVSGRLTNIQAMDALIPGNGCLADTLLSIVIRNKGTARDGHISRVALWEDDGDGLFSPASDIEAGAFVTTDNVDFRLQGLSVPLEGGAGNRFFVTVDLVEGYTTGANILFEIPVNGLEVTTGNDGPVDMAVSMDAPIVIPIPDRITVYASLLGNKRVYAGRENVLNMVLGAYNSYSEARFLESLVLLKGGSSRVDEIGVIKAWSDADKNGLFDPDSDELLAWVIPDGVLVGFDDLGLSLEPYMSSLLFITYDLPETGVRDSVSIDLSIPEYKYIKFADVNVRIEGQFPLDSAGSDWTDGMTAAQISVAAIDDRRAVPGENGIQCFTARIPCDGTNGDLLAGLTLHNAGTARVGVDIDYLRLWREAGGDPERFDEGAEEFIGYLVWNGSAWSNISPLMETIGCEGLTIHVTADLAESAEGGATVSMFVPVNGIAVESGNDGPLDAVLPGSNTITVTTDPLLVSFAVPPGVTVGQSFYLDLNVVNATDTTILSVSPDSFAWAGEGGVGLLSGPEPAGVDIGSGQSASFRWTLEALSYGAVVFEAMAGNHPRNAASVLEYSDTLLVESAPSGVNVTLDDLTPVNLNRGRSDVAAIEMTASYSGSCPGCAGVDISRISLLFTDGAGNPVPVGEVIDALTFEDKERVLASIVTRGVTDSFVTIVPDQPITMVPGGISTSKISIDVAPDAPAGEFRIRIESASWLSIEDHNSGEPVAFGGIDFPWSTNTVTLKDPATELTAAMTGTIPDRINRGQENVPVFMMTLTNDGGSSGADISVSMLELGMLGDGGVPAEPGGAIRKFQLRDQSGYTFFATGDFGDSGSIECIFNPGLIISPGIPLVLHASIDASFEPAGSVIGFSLEDSLGISARDINSGASVAVTADTDEGFSFPMVTNMACFMDPLGGISVEASGLLPDGMMASDEGVAVFDIVVAHTGQPGESPAELSSITLRLLDNAGMGIAVNSIVEELSVMAGDTVAGTIYPSSADTSSYITVTLMRPLKMNAGESLVLSVILCVDDRAPTGYIQFHIAENGVYVSDATSGERFADMEGAFPLTSGISEIFLPADRITFDAKSIIPSNAAPGGEIAVFAIGFYRGAGEGGSNVVVNALAVVLLNIDGTPLDAQSVVEAVRLECGGADISHYADMTEGVIDIALQDVPGIAPGSSLEMRLYCTLSGTGGAKGVSAVIESPGAVGCHDAASGLPVAVYPAEGRAFPFQSAVSTLIADDIRASFSNYPNPFTPSETATRIVFYMPVRGRVELGIYTVLGRLVRRLIGGEYLEAGLHQDIVWDGENGSGEKVMNGVYHLVLRIDEGAGWKEYRRKAAVAR